MLENNNAVLAVVDPVYPGTALRPGSSGSEVARMQTYLNGLRTPSTPPSTVWSWTDGTAPPPPAP